MFTLRDQRMLTSAILGTAAMLAIAAPASATTIPYVRALTAIHTPENTDPNAFFTIDNQLSPGSTASAQSASSAASGTWGQTSTTAAADLANGTLRASDSMTNIGADNIYTQTNAGFGDGFRTQSPTGPFEWGPNSTAQFTMDLTGTISSSPGLESLGAGAFIIMAIYQPNTLDPTANLIGVPNLMQYYMWLLGNPNQELYSCDFNNNCAQLFSSGYYSTFPAQITQTITPGGDFDWAIVLGASGSTQSLGSYNIDFANTLKLSYQGPEGATTTSVSGTFANIDLPPPTTVPEPATLALFGLGLVGIGLARRRKTH